MKIKLYSWINSYDELESNVLNIDDKKTIRIQPLCECPEDAIIGRDLISGEDIIQFMKLSYEAGKNGEEFDIEYFDKEPN